MGMGAFGWAGLVHPRDDASRYTLPVLFPLSAILIGALMVIAPLTVQQQDAKVHGVEVGDGGDTASWKAPCNTHQPIPQVIDVACHAPPA